MPVPLIWPALATAPVPPRDRPRPVCDAAMTGRRAATLLLLAGLLTTLAGWCAEVRDDLGHILRMPHPAKRIITLAPHATELVLAAGAGHRLVGIASGGGNDPSTVAALPRIGGPGALDREQLLKLQPDLVIGWQSGNRNSDLDWIERTGINLYRSDPASLQQIADAIRAIGSLSGSATAAEAAADAFTRALATPCANFEPLPAYVEVWETPALTVGGMHWLNEVLRVGGFRNLFATVPRGVFAIDAETALARRSFPTISLVQTDADGTSARLADLLSRPAPGLAEAVSLLCDLRRAEMDAKRARGTAPPPRPGPMPSAD